MLNNKTWAHDASQYSEIYFRAPGWKWSCTLVEGENVRDVIERECKKWGIDVKTVTEWTIEHTVIPNGK